MCCVFVISNNDEGAHANSYLDMLTEPPEGYEKSTFVGSAVEVMPQHNTLAWWYDSRIKTGAPVVVFSYPKYYA